MAEKEEKIEQEIAKPQEKENQTPRRSLLPWIIIAVVIAALSGSGFVLGRLLGRPAETPTVAQASTGDESAQPDNLILDDSSKNPKKPWYYDLEPVVANLDEPGVTRYIRASLTLVVDPKLDKTNAQAFFEEKKPILTNWLTIFLASLTLEDTRGDRNLRHIQSMICNAFNEELFANSKPRIKNVLFREFAIQ